LLNHVGRSGQLESCENACVFSSLDENHDLSFGLVDASRNIDPRRVCRCADRCLVRLQLFERVLHLLNTCDFSQVELVDIGADRLLASGDDPDDNGEGRFALNPQPAEDVTLGLDQVSL